VASEDDGAGLGSATKEVLSYREALYLGLDLLESRGLTTNTMVAIMQRLKNTTEGIRKTTGTKLANPITNEVIYTPPEGENLLREKLSALEKFIYNDNDEIDALIKMALLHYQFEAIHPFSDGNGRTGRILNVLFLVQKNLLNIPVLYLSSYIIQHKSDYYRLLKEVTEKENWKDWILFMLGAVSETALVTLQKIEAIQELKKETSIHAKHILGNSYKSELIDLMFSYPYLKIRILEKNEIAQRQTASVYLQKLAKANILRPLKIGKEMYYINHRLTTIFSS
jgi:Fic family protein